MRKVRDKKLLIKIRHKSNKKDLDFLDFSLHVFGLKIVSIYSVYE